MIYVSCLKLLAVTVFMTIFGDMITPTSWMKDGRMLYTFRANSQFHFSSTYTFSSSILIHTHLYSSILIHTHPYSSILIQAHLCLSILSHTHPYLSILIHTHPYSSILNAHPYSILIHTHQYISMLIHTHPYSSIYIHIH